MIKKNSIGLTNQLVQINIQHTDRQNIAVMLYSLKTIFKGLKIID